LEYLHGQSLSAQHRSGRNWERVVQSRSMGPDNHGRQLHLSVPGPTDFPVHSAALLADWLLLSTDRTYRTACCDGLWRRSVLPCMRPHPGTYLLC
ncbi:hypothetical protein FRC01_013030, partial [Tulasnella sp. 417]